MTLNEQPPRGEAIRKAGIDIARGDIVLKTGVRLKPQHCALAASVGTARSLLPPAARCNFLYWRRTGDAG